MKFNIAIIILVFFSALVLVGCQRCVDESSVDETGSQIVSDVPEAVFTSTEHNFGKVPARSLNTCSFILTNAGGRDLVIEKIYASCGCTTTAAQNTTIKPGQTSSIEVTYKAGSSGKSKKRIAVYTNDPNAPQTELWITAEIKPSPKKAATAPKTKTQSPKTPGKGTIPPSLNKALRNLNKATGK